MKLSEAPDDLLINSYIQYRDEVAQIEARHKAELAPTKSRMEKLEAEFLRRFNERGAESVRTNAGTAYRSLRTSVTCADWNVFLNQFVIPNNAWDMLDHRANKTSVLQYREAHGDIPPGLNFSADYTVGFQRARGA